jgi:uncharacterized protein YyaL (SSP411 family)
MTTHAEQFHFSPRPNRASEIAWRAWSEDAFAQAKRDDKPILLSISAVWCHWCHVMDETSYSDPAVIAQINERFIPVRVDNDRRPDVNARYNQGGWPTTAFLTPEGALLAGATYLPPEQMRSALEQISEFYKTNRTQIEQRATELRGNRRSYELSPASDLRESMIARIIEEISDIYDPEYGGFGNAPKFPMIDVLDFLLQEYRVTGEQRLYDMVAESMLAMSTGGMYDHQEGGFFRYSTTRDWTIPHFEKMTEDHAGLLRVLSVLVRTTRNERFRSTLLSALTYIRTVLRDPETNFFAGSQDADEEYYALPLDERRRQQAPYVDRTSYSNWTAAMAGTFILAGEALDDERLLREGEATLDALHERMRDEDGLLYHFVPSTGSGQAPQVRGLLTDQAAYLRALLDAHEFVGSPRFLERARNLAVVVERHFKAEDAGFYDHAAMEDTLGSLDVRDRPLPDNSLLAESFLRLAELDEQPRYREIAERTLTVFAKTYGRAGTFAAPYGRALRRYLSRPTTVVLVGSPKTTEELREGAHALPEPLITVRTIAKTERQVLESRGFDPELQPVAYVCAGTACGAPARTVAELRDSYESVSAPS